MPPRHATRNLLASCALACVFTGGAGAAELVVEVRDAAGLPLADAVVYAEAAAGAPPAPPEGLRAQIDQVKKEFVPRVSVVRAGTSVNFPNSDNIRHSIYSFSQPKTFATKLYSGREAPPVVFDRTGVVVLGCNIHDTMVAWVVIVDTPWFAKSGADGRVVLRNLPDGAYRVTGVSPSVNLAPTVIDVDLRGAAPVRRALILTPVT
jgi:plastocyanin